MYTYTFADKPVEKVASDIQQIYNIITSVPLEEKTVKEYMLRDFVVDCVAKSDISKHDAPFVLSYIFLCHILKLFSLKDVSITKGRINDIMGIDTHKYTMSNIVVRNEQRTHKIKRMDALWLKNSV